MKLFEWLRRRSTNQGTDGLIARGNLAENAGRLQEACELYREAVRLAPQSAKAHLNLGIALEALGDSAGAYEYYEKALAIDAANPYASYNLGKLLYARAELPRARRLLEQALRNRSDFPEARIVLAYVLQAQGELAAAATQLKTALPQRPEDFVARAALFHILEALGDLAAAATQLEAVLRQKPDWTEALYNYGRTLMRLERDAEAEAALRRVLALDPRFLLAYRMLGNLLHRQGRVDEMLELCRAGRRHLPQSFELESFELLLLNFTDGISEHALYERHRAFGERLERGARRFALARERVSARRLRVGYVSGDFNYHPVGLFTLPVLERHDRERFEVFCYATGAKNDELTRRLSAHADAWQDVRALSEAQLAETVHRDRIDILIDLAGHSGISRLGVFAQQPAPVQAAWLGYLNTTGLSRIRYRITDRYCDPPGVADRLHTETLVRLPQSQWCYRPFVAVEHAPTPPLERAGHVTFGSFNQTAKLSRTTRLHWAQILRQLPDARLVVVGVAPGPAADSLLRDLTETGVGAAQITLVPFVPVQEYLRWYDAVDIALDPMPYSGGTTTCDALWMGVPVLTAPGLRSVSRSAASVLAGVGLGEWIARDAEDYVGRAVRFAAEAGRLAELRRTLRERMRASPLMDEARFTRDLEEAYLQMWREWCAAQG